MHLDRLDRTRLAELLRELATAQGKGARFSNDETVDAWFTVLKALPSRHVETAFAWARETLERWPMPAVMRKRAYAAWDAETGNRKPRLATDGIDYRCPQCQTLADWHTFWIRHPKTSELMKREWCRCECAHRQAYHPIYCSDALLAEQDAGDRFANAERKRRGLLTG